MIRVLALSLLFLVIGSGCSSQTPADSTSVDTVKKLSDSAHAYERAGNTQKALHYHKKALQKSQDLGLPEHEARTLVNIAMLLKKEDADQSLGYLNKALKIAEQLHHSILKSDILLAMAGIYKQQENYQEALKTLEAHQQLLQTVFAKEKTHEIEEARAAEKRKLRRIIYLLLLVSVLTVAIVFASYFLKTRRLNRELQASNEVKDKLFSIISHDLRGPAGGMTEALGMIDAGVLDPASQKEVIGLLKKQSEAFNETLNSLLKWASTQLRGAETNPAHFAIGPLIQKSVNILEGQAREKQLQIEVAVPDELLVRADMDHTDFVIRNLLSNAIKFSYENGAIRVAATKENKKVILSVADRGTGMTAEQQQKFSSTAQYLESGFGTKGEKGTGLGLGLSREFVHANKGTIWLESEKGKGTTFYVALPEAL